MLSIQRLLRAERGNQGVRRRNCCQSPERAGATAIEEASAPQVGSKKQ